MKDFFLNKKKINPNLELIVYLFSELIKSSSGFPYGAVGWNKICLIIPCHRVIGKNNELVGYGGGLKNKLLLLELEKESVNK